MSLSSKLNAWIRSPQGQARLQEKMAEYTRDGVEKLPPEILSFLKAWLGSCRKVYTGSSDDG